MALLYRKNGESLHIDVVLSSSKLLTATIVIVTMARVGGMNIILHGLKSRIMGLQRCLGKSLERLSSLMLSWLFHRSWDRRIKMMDYDRLRDLAPNKSDLLFVQLILHLLKRGGRAAGLSGV